MVKRLHVLFEGIVQGVGFRFTTEHISRHFEVTGCVRNLPDGKVEMIADGEESVLKDFLKAVCEGPMGSFIRDFQTAWQEPENKFSRFYIAT